MVNVDFAERARSRNSSTASCLLKVSRSGSCVGSGNPSDDTRNTASPAMASASRLVVRTCRSLARRSSMSVS